MRRSGRAWKNLVAEFGCICLQPPSGGKSSCKWKATKAVRWTVSCTRERAAFFIGMSPKEEPTLQMLHGPHVFKLFIFRCVSAVLHVSPCSSCGSRKEPHRRHSPIACTHSVSKSFFCTFDVVVRRQDTSRRHRSSIPATCCQAPLEKRVLFRRLSRVRSVSCESCAWSCGALSRLFRGAQKSVFSLSSSCVECSTGDTVGFATRRSCIPRTDCFHAPSAAWAAF